MKQVVDKIIAKTKCETRPYQRTIIDKSVAMFNGKYENIQGMVEPPAKSVMIESPTGSGKTVLGHLVAKILQHENPDLVIGWVAMRRNLLSQAANENKALGINAPISYISMFDKDPQELVQARRDGKTILMVVDECLAGETLVNTLVNGKESLVPISEIVEHGVGSHVLSYNQENDCLEWMPITSRTCTGVREVFEVEIETEDGRVVVVTATANHRFLTGSGEYVRVDDLVEGSEVFVKHEKHVRTQESVPSGTVRARIKSIKPVGVTKTYDIGVEKNHNFFANDVLVHNCQHDAATSMAHLHNKIEPDMILGLTATPFRTDRVKLCFDKVVKDAGIHSLIQDGYLSRYEHFSIPEWTPETVADHYCNEPERWGKSVVFFLRWDECQRFEQILREREPEIRERLKSSRPDLTLEKGLVRAVEGGGSKRDIELRDELLDDFRDGKVAVLVNCMVLTEGFDAPNLETAFVRDSGRGPTTQMAGRAFRVHPEFKKNKDERFSRKRIVQSRQTRWPMMRTALADLQYLWQENEWRSLQLNPNMEKINNRSRQAIAQTVVELPKFITNKQERPRRIRF